MAELTVPRIDFSPIGDLPQVYQQAQDRAKVQQTLANLGQGGQINPMALIQSGNLDLARLGMNYLTHQQDKDTENQHWAAENDLAKRRVAIAEDKTPAGFEKADDGSYSPIKGGPKDPNYLRTVAQIDNENGKPIPVETIGGTKFLVRGPQGMQLVDPNNLPVQPTPGVPGGAFGGLGFKPVGWDDQKPAPGVPGQTADAAPANFAQRFGAAFPQATPPQAPQPADPNAIDPQTGRREGFLKTLDPQVQAYLKKIVDYEIDPRTTSVKGGARERIMSAAAQYDPAYRQEEYGARAKATRDFSTGPQGNAIRTFDVGIDHLDTLQKYAKALDNGDKPLINKIRIEWLKATGSELPTDVQAVTPIVGAEVSKAIIGSNNALADREELRKPLITASSPAQLSGAIGAYKDLMAGQLRGLKKQYEDTTGKKDFDTRVRENTRNVLLGRQSKEPVTIDGYTITEH